MKMKNKRAEQEARKQQVKVEKAVRSGLVRV